VLEANVVVVVEVVDADDRVTATKEALRGVHADETGRFAPVTRIFKLRLAPRRCR
jgi:PII-like signaling protein